MKNNNNNIRKVETFEVTLRRNGGFVQRAIYVFEWQARELAKNWRAQSALGVRFTASVKKIFTYVEDGLVN